MSEWLQPQMVTVPCFFSIPGVSSHCGPQTQGEHIPHRSPLGASFMLDTYYSLSVVATWQEFHTHSGSPPVDTLPTSGCVPALAR